MMYEDVSPMYLVTSEGLKTNPPSSLALTFPEADLLVPGLESESILGAFLTGSSKLSNGLDIWSTGRFFPVLGKLNDVGGTTSLGFGFIAIRLLARTGGPILTKSMSLSR